MSNNTLEKLLQTSYVFDNVSNIENFKKQLTQFLITKKIPLYFAPEGKHTSGKALLKFKKYPFEVTNKIQPVSISIKRPLIDIATSTLGSNYYSDTFYYMFCPITTYKLRFLPSLEKKSISSDEFAEIARQNIASSLKVRCLLW